MDELVATLNNGGKYPLESEVVIAVPSIHLRSVSANIRKDINISSQVKSQK